MVVLTNTCLDPWGFIVFTHNNERFTIFIDIGEKKETLVITSGLSQQCAEFATKINHRDMTQLRRILEINGKWIIANEFLYKRKRTTRLNQYMSVFTKFQTITGMRYTKLRLNHFKDNSKSNRCSLTTPNLVKNVRITLSNIRKFSWGGFAPPDPFSFFHKFFMDEDFDPPLVC